MEHYSLNKLLIIGTDGMLNARKVWLISVIRNRQLNGQNCDATRAELAKLEAAMIKR